MNKLIITNHAIQRYKERTKTKRDDDWIKSRIEERLQLAVEVKHKNPSLAALSIMQNSYEKATYYHHGDMIFVVVDNIVVTLHNGSASRWKIPPSKPKNQKFE